MSGGTAFLETIARSVLERLGVNYPQYRTLLRVSLWLDFRDSGQSLGMRQESSPLPVALAMYAFFSLLLSLLAFVLPAELFARFMLLFGMTIAGMAMLIDFGVTLVMPSDIGVVGWRPISSRTYFAARLTNALCFVAMFTLALELIPSVFGVFSKGAPRAFPLVFLPCALLGSLFTAGVIAASYASLLRIFRRERFRDVVNYFQILLMVLFMAGSQVIPRLEAPVARSGRSSGGAASVWSWWDALPPRWFAAPVEVLLRGPTARGILLSAAAIFSTGLLFVVLVRTLSLSYLEGIVQAGVPPTSRKLRRTRGGWFRSALRFVLRTPEERVMFDFVRRILARDRAVRLRLYPMLLYILVPVIALFTGAHRRGPGGLSLFTTEAATLFTFCFLSMMLMMHLPYSGESQGAWIFDLAGFEKPPRAAAGIKKCLFLCLYLPVALLLFSLMVFFLDPASAASVVLLGLMGGLLLLELEFLFLFQGLPFARPMPVGRSTANLGYMLLAFPVGGAMIILTYLFLRGSRQYLFVGLALIPALWALDWLTNARYSPTTLPAPEDGPIKLLT